MNQRNKRCWELLKSLDLTEVNVEYSGGNDSGAIDRIEGIKADGTNLTIEFHDVQENHSGQKSMIEELIEWLTEPVYATYGSFAGDYYCSGRIEFDVKNRTVTLYGTETQEVDVDRVILGYEYDPEAVEESH